MIASALTQIWMMRRARTTEIDDVHQYVCHSGAIPAQRTRSKCTLVPQNVSLVRMTTTTAVHVLQDTGAFEPESTHSADDYRTTKISQPPTAEWDGPTNFTLFDKRLAQATLPNAPIDNEQLYNCGCESPTPPLKRMSMPRLTQMTAIVMPRLA